MSSTSISSSDSAILNAQQKAGPRGGGEVGIQSGKTWGSGRGGGNRAVDQFPSFTLYNDC